MALELIKPYDVNGKLNNYMGICDDESDEPAVCPCCGKVLQLDPITKKISHEEPCYLIKELSQRIDRVRLLEELAREEKKYINDEFARATKISYPNVNI